MELWETGLAAASSILSYPEGRAALAAARRIGRLSAATHRTALHDFEDLHHELALLGVDLILARYAGKLADELELRGYEAVHLASALSLGASTTVVTWDGDLARAASVLGCAIAPPLAGASS